MYVSATSVCKPVLMKFLFEKQGLARTQTPSPRNYALESSTFEMIGEVNPPQVQWTGLAPGAPPE